MSLPVTWVDGWGFISGLGPVDLQNASVPLPEMIEAQTRKILSNLEALLKPRGLARTDVVSVRIHLIEFKRLHERARVTFNEFFTGPRQPARSWVGVSALTRGAQIEMDFVVRDATPKAAA
jgi:2-iminobutanoate/2-iminopropanoate deaminase